MRGLQMAGIMQAQLGDGYEVRAIKMPHSNIPGLQRAWVKSMPSGAVFIFTKLCTRSLTPDNALILQKKSAGICFDHVDYPVDQIWTTGVDIHLSCSYAQQREYSTHFSAKGATSGKPMLLLHNYDTRLEDMSVQKTDALRTVYFGTSKTRISSPKIDAQMDQLNGSTKSDFESSLSALTQYNFHYAVRPVEAKFGGNSISPFTKGFTAAAVGANILVNRQTIDAEDFLGPDYPFLIDGNAESDIMAGLAKANALFGGKEWQEGLDRMSHVRDQVAPAALATQFRALLNELDFS
jgi:hypothetical protein